MLGISLLTDINGGCHPTRTEIGLFKIVSAIRSINIEIARFSQNQDKMQKNENLTVFEAVAADAVSYADAVLEDLDKKK